MAGEFLLTFAAEGILTKVSSLAAQELSLAWGFKTELEKLGQSLLVIQDYLCGAAEQKPGEQSKGVEDWVKKLKDITHDANDVLDEFHYEILRRKVELQNHVKRKVINFLSASNPLLFRLKMAHKVKKINDSLVKLKNEAGIINLVAKKRDSRPGGERSGREQTDSFLEKDEKVVGRKDMVTKIVETLINSNNQQNLSIMAIVGMPGLGKTTLAKSVYNEPAISRHFEKKIWVCVSNNFEVDTILSQMVDSLIPEKAGIKSHDALLKVLEKELKEKRYFLVLDDVWNENSTKWESLISSLSKLSAAPRSSIIITTRNEKVAMIPKPLARWELDPLTNEECWSILKQRALFSNGDDPGQEKIGREIAKKCKGVPLVAKVLGNTMRSKTKDEWLSIQQSELWKLPNEEDIIMKVLKISFDNLKSPALKQCFAYCSMLRKDFEIERDDLIQLWMAEGLLDATPDGSHCEMEDVGNQYFNVLLENSLLQEVTEGDTITKYTMHDLVHDLAEEVSKCDCLTRDQNVSREIRHVAHLPILRLSCMLETVGRLRSLFSNDPVPHEIFSKFRALRVFSLLGEEIDELPDSFGKLKHLRYLDISNTNIKVLPKSIGKLYNLQTLRVQNRFLEKIPREIQNLTNLRHLYFNKDVKVPAGIFRGLKDLRTLPHFNVGIFKDMRIEELGDLDQLQGKLAIRNLENVWDEKEASKAKLEDKKNLLELSFLWTEFTRWRYLIKDESVLERLQPHTKLESLEIENYMGSKFPSWMMRSPLPLYNLKNFILSGCLKCEELPVLGHLQSLKHVKIYEMKNLKRLGSEFYGYNHVHEATREKTTSTSLFPALKTLSIGLCAKLTEWMEASTSMTSEVFPRLEVLEIYSCGSLTSIPISQGLASLRELRIKSCEGLLSIGQLDHCTSLQVLKIYSCRSLSSIPISQGLPSLRELNIEYCDGLLSIGQLDHCTSLQELKIQHCGSLSSIPISQGLPSLRELKIEYCDGLLSISQLDHCSSLQVLYIRYCGSLTSIPISQGLASLRELRIKFCDGLSSLGSGIENCTSLQEISIVCCSNLVTISFTRVLPSLRRLEVFSCDKLSCLPDLAYCPSLQVLSVCGCPKLASISFSTESNRCRHCLQELNISNCDGLQSLPDFHSFTSLRELIIGKCAGLENLVSGFHIPVSVERLKISGFHNLESLTDVEECTSLRQLEICDCKKLKSLPTGLRCLDRLEKLALGPFWEELDTFPDFQVPSQQLVSLLLHGWPKLKSVPQPIIHFTSVEEMTIGHFNGVKALPEWLGNLASLRRLNVWSCESVKYLPSLKAVRGLNKLYTLEICHCPLLKERCTKDSGEEWPKISHVQDIRFSHLR